MTTETNPKPDAISVVLVAERSDDSLEKSVSAWVAHLDKSEREYEVLVVGCGTTVAPKLFSRFERVKVAAQEPGLGAAIRAGLTQTKHPLFFYTMGDQRYRAADLAKLLPHADKCGMILGCRWEYDETWTEWLINTPLRWVRRPRPDLDPYRESWSEWRLRVVAQHVFGVRFRDPSCIYMLTKRAIFKNIPIQSDGFFGHIEIMAKGTFTNVEMEQVAISYRPGKETRPNPSWLGESWRVFQRPRFTL